MIRLLSGHLLAWLIVVLLGEVAFLPCKASAELDAGTTYYMSPIGNDSNDGLSPETAWLTPNHAVKCGDVIIAVAGSYVSTNLNPGMWGTVSNCPSANGIWFATLKCEGPHVSSCSVFSTTDSIRIDKPNWAVVGWLASSKSGSCFAATPSKAENIHHIAFINVIANGCANNGVNFYPYPANRKYSVDYFAVVGAIVNNASFGRSLCFSGLSLYEPTAHDNTPGTHLYVAGNFSFNNKNPDEGCFNGANSDGNGLILDDFNHDQHTKGIAYNQQTVVENNILVGNGAAGINSFRISAGKVVIRNNTTWGNYTSKVHEGTYKGEMLTNLVSAPTIITDNIFQSDKKTQNGSSVFAAYVGLSSRKVVIKGNYILGVGGNNVRQNKSPTFSYGRNIIADPLFAKPRTPEEPNCHSATTTQCMAELISNFTPGAKGAAGKGYQPPRACRPNELYPNWLKGVVPDGIITKPCHM
jgi:hypothetical protein